MSPEDSSTTASGWRSLVHNPASVLFQIILVVIIAAGVTLSRVEESVTSPSFADDPTPLGYTWSLVLFILPLGWLLLWLALHPEMKIQKKSFFTTLAILLPLGFLLDLFFANTFFIFKNKGAITGIEIPGVGGGRIANVVKNDFF